MEIRSVVVISMSIHAEFDGIPIDYLVRSVPSSNSIFISTTMGSSTRLVVDWYCSLLLVSPGEKTAVSPKVTIHDMPLQVGKDDWEDDY